MNKIRIVTMAIVSTLALSGAAAMAASDYLLEIKGVPGENAATSTPQTIEVASWSWGTSNPTSAGSGGLAAGKAAMQDMSASTDAPAAGAQVARDAASGMPTGKRAAAAVPAASATGLGQAETAPKVGDMATLVVMVRESPTRASAGLSVAKQGACAAGQHFGSVVLTGQGKRYEMTDVTVTSCADAGNGLRQKELKGHVTLIK